MAVSSQRIREIQQELTRRERAPQEGSESTVDYLAFFLGEERFAFPLRDVQEVARLGPITPIPGVHPAVLGAIARHGEVLPVLDLRRLLRLQEAPQGPESRLLIVRHGDTRAALLVDRVEDIVAVPERSFHTPPAPAQEATSSFLQALAGDGPAMLRILDLAALLETVRHGT
ncbi:MAG: chemotaxis protein CheW [Chloroflexia bacterium]